ncbi:MAG: magnesium transporter [Verrucomicrobia bacterium]|nr:magnesium transporter [Verrucomicrobiota bacterium]
MSPAKTTSESQPEEAGYSLDFLLNLDHEEIKDLERNRLEETPPVELAHFIDRLDIDHRREVLRMVSDHIATDILAEMDLEASAEVFEAMGEPRAARILEELDPDDATDVVAELEDQKREDLLSKMEPESAQTVKELLGYDPDTAGGIMTPDVCSIREFFSVDEAIQAIRQQAEELETIYYVYVVDEDEKLVGVVSIRDLFLTTQETAVTSLMKTQILGLLAPDTDKEQAANLMAEYNLIALPVVNQNGKLLGIVTHDDVIDIIQAEATEDIQKLVGAGADETIHDTIAYSLKKRHIWLQVNLFTVALAAGVVYIFEAQIASLTFLAVFMPIIAATGGNTGAQALAVVIRSLALEDIHDSDKVKLYLKELIKGLINGMGVGLIGAGLAYLIKQDLKTSVVVFIAMVLTMGISGFSGAFIPLFLKKLKLDPAQSSSIFVTTITDITGFFIFLSLGSWLLL